MYMIIRVVDFLERRCPVGLIKITGFSMGEEGGSGEFNY
jgi:hypothetical protein